MGYNADTGYISATMAGTGKKVTLHSVMMSSSAAEIYCIGIDDLRQPQKDGAQSLVTVFFPGYPAHCELPTYRVMESRQELECYFKVDAGVECPKPYRTLQARIRRALSNMPGL